MKNEMVEMTAMEMASVNGGDWSWSEVGLAWGAGGAALGAVAAVASALALAPVIVIGAAVLGAVYAASGAAMMYADSVK